MTEISACPRHESLMAFALGEPAVDVADHVSDCTICQAAVSRLRLMVSSLRQTLSFEKGAESTVHGAASGKPAGRPAALGKYIVVGELGRGGQAQVFRALHPTLGRDVAIKWSHQAVGQEAVDHLTREGKLLAELDHPGMVRVFDLDVQDGRPFLVMEYVRGSDLEQYAAQHPLSPQQSAALVAKLARALAVAHARGIVHQDIKPRNILIDETGKPRLSDFGIARWRNLWSDGSEEQPMGGTMGYMAPEQLATPDAVSPASDVFALGGVLFFLLAGQAPRQTSDNPVLAWKQVERGEIDWARLQGRKVPDRLEEICRKALATDAAQRYSRAEDLATDLEKIAQPTHAWGRRLGSLAACLAVLALGWALLAGWNPFGRSQEDPNRGGLAQPAMPALTLRVLRDGNEFIARDRAELDGFLPIRAQDKLGVSGSAPAKMQVALFAVTLSEDAPSVQELGPLERAKDRFTFARLVPLENSPATELLFVCGAENEAPTKKQVSSVLSKLPWRAGALLPGNVLLSFDAEKVQNPLLGRVGVPEDDPVVQTLAQLDKVRQALQMRFPLVSGIAFTHVAQANTAQRHQEVGTGGGKATDGYSGGTPAQQKLFREVMERLLQTKPVRTNFPVEFVWPPKTYIVPRAIALKTGGGEFNAMAGAWDPVDRKVHVHPVSKKYIAHAFITEGYMDKIVQGDAEILAAIMGHELAHLTKRHLFKGEKGDLQKLEGIAFRRDQEFEADLEGVKIAMAASYHYRSGIRSAFREWKILGKRSSFEAIAGTHPSWAERLQMLDREQAKIWKAMAAFENGAFFLNAEQYRIAETCYQNAVEEFPDCAEGHANLGYARLMQYCDGLEEEDVRKLDIGHVVTGAFYTRPSGLVPTRGFDREKWQAAVKSLEKAAELDAKLVLTRANLGLAYLVHPDGKKTEQAIEYFRKAYNPKDPGLDPRNVAAVLINFAVADHAMGLTKEARAKLSAAAKLLQSVPGLAPLRFGLLYNAALLDAAGDRASKVSAFKAFEIYLIEASSNSNWWNLAFEQYDKLGKELELPRKSRDKLATFYPPLMRPIVGVEFEKGRSLILADATEKVLKTFKCDNKGIPIYFRSKVKRYNLVPGVDILAGDKLLTIFLNGDKAPPVVVQEIGTGTKKHQLNVGMSEKDCMNVFGKQPYEKRFVDNPTIEFRFFPQMGLAVRFQGDRVHELAITQLPRK